MEQGYYAIIPANVRYCKELCPNAKLLYGEITALCNRKGFCWAKTSYFTELYGCDERTVRRWIEQLAENKFIFVNISYEEDGKTVKQRCISLTEDPEITPEDDAECPHPMTEMSPPLGTKMSGPSLLKNNTRENSTTPTPPDTKHAYGEYKWVKLSDTQYDKLVSKIGKKELDRCIKYIDESAQSTGNKNRWKDWGLVIQRCSREGWGKSKETTEERYGYL